MKSPTVSVVLIVKNERHNMEEYFHTVSGVADELVIVDTGSTDGTLQAIETLQKTVPFPVRVFHFVREQFHDSKTREYAAQQAQCDYILQVDADERLSGGFTRSLKNFLRDVQPDVAKIPRIDELVPHLIDVMDYRLYRRGGAAHYGEAPEESVHPKLHYSGQAVLFNEPIYHYQGKNHWLRRPNRVFDQLSREVEKEENTRGFLREFYRGVTGFFYKFRRIYVDLEVRKDGKAGFKFAFLKGLYVLIFHVFVGLKPRTIRHVNDNH